MADLNALVDELSQLTVMEAAQLSKMLEEKWGVSASAPVQQAQDWGASEPAEPIEEQTEFTVTLTAIDPAKKLNVIKEVRTITSLGLKEAKELVESAPKVIRESANKDDANKIKKQLEDVGGIVTLT
jgi:large subunit ribosomal protein L7/L12